MGAFFLPAEWLGSGNVLVGIGEPHYFVRTVITLAKKYRFWVSGCARSCHNCILHHAENFGD